MADDLATIGYKADLTGINQINKGLNSIGATGEKTEKKMNAAGAGIGRSMGAVGIQVQQLAGQIQGGQSPFLALSQQAADIGIVLGAPMIGVLTAFGATFAGMVLPSLFDTTDAMESLEKQTEKLSNVFTISKSGVIEYANEMQRLVQVSQGLARINLQNTIDKQKELMKSAATQISTAFNDAIGKNMTAAGFERVFGSYSDEMVMFVSSTQDMMSNIAAEGVTDKNINQLTAALSKAREMGLGTTETGRELIETLSKLVVMYKDGEKAVADMTSQLDKNNLSLTESADATSVYDTLLKRLAISSEDLRSKKLELEKASTLEQAASDGVSESKRNEIAAAYDNLIIKEKEKEASAIFIEQQKKENAAREAAEAALKKQVLAYNNWLNSIDAAVNPTKALQEEIYDIWEAILGGDIDETTGQERIEQLNKQIDKLNGVSSEVAVEDPYSGFINGSSEALAAIQNLTEDGSSAYNDLAIAINAAATAQALLSGNYLGALASGASILASLGSNDFEDISVTVQANQSLNMWGEKSNSIADATETTAKAAEKLVGINTDMLDALNNLTDAISSASGIIATSTADASVDTSSLGISSNVFTESFLGDNFLSSILYNGLNDAMYDVMNTMTLGLFGAIGSWLGGSSSVVDSGIAIIGGTLSTLINETIVQAYQTVSYKKWRFGGTKSTTAYADAGDAVSQQFSLVFESLADAVYAGGTAMGLSSEYLTNAINNFVVSTESISLKDLSTDEVVEELNSYFSDVYNSLVESVVPWLSNLQDTGEELGDTFARVAGEVALLQYAVENLGVISYGSAQQVAYSADAISDLMGGYEEFTDALASFFDYFATDDQKLALYSSTLEDALSDIGLELPNTTSGFYSLLSGLNANTTAGQEAIATILSLTDTASAYYDLLEDTQETMASLSDSFASAVMDIYDLSDATTQVSLDAALAAARLGDFSLAEALDLSDYTVDSSDYATYSEYALAQAQMASKLYEISQLAADEAGDVATQQLDTLNSINDKIQVLYDAMSSNAKSAAQTASILQRIVTNGLATYTD